MRVLVTRPREDAADTANALAAIGCEAVLEPLLTVEFDDAVALDTEGAQAVLLTSANGARAVARRGAAPALPAFAVGAVTAEAAVEAGFAEVHSADGDVDDLAKLVAERLDPADGAVVHVAASVSAGDLGGALEKAGFAYRRAVLYAAEPARALSPAAIAAIRDGGVDAVVFYSPRTAETFVGLARRARLVRACRELTAFCLSKAVADAAQGLDWRDVRIATHPTQDALMETIGQEAGRRGAAQPGRSALPASGGGSEMPRDAEEPSAAGAPAPPAPTPRPGMGPLSKLLVYTASVVVILAVVAASSPLWIDHARKVVPGLGTNPETEQRVARLTDRVAELEASREGDIIPDLRTLQAERRRLAAEIDSTFQRLETVEEQLSDVRSMVEALNADMSPAEAEGALRKLSDRLSALEESAGLGDTSGTIAVLKEKVAELERVMPKAPREAENRASLLALGQLREAVRAGRGYSAELAAFRSVSAPEAGTSPDASPDAEHLDALAARAADGLPTQEQLRSAFDKLAGRIVRAAVVEPEGSWVDRTLARVAALVQWRRTDDLEGEGVQAVVARAELRLKAGNLEAAAAEIATLAGAPAEVAGPWLADARAVIAAEQALTALQVRAIGQLTGGQ